MSATSEEIARTKGQETEKDVRDRIAREKPKETTQMKSITKLNDKNHSPMVIRRYSKFGSPIFVGIITDDVLSNLDDLVVSFMKQDHIQKLWRSDDIQNIRNIAGMLSEELIQTYDKIEGVAITFCIDKGFVSSLFGDFMSHAQCKYEYYSLLNMATNI